MNCHGNSFMGMHFRVDELAGQFIDGANHQGVQGAEPLGFAEDLGSAEARFAGGPGGAAPWYCKGSGGRSPLVLRGSGGRSPPAKQGSLGGGTPPNFQN